MVCFADINVSQSSVATYARCGGVFDIPLTANLPTNLPVKKIFLNQLRIDRIVVMSLCPVAPFFGPPCTLSHCLTVQMHLTNTTTTAHITASIPGQPG